VAPVSQSSSATNVALAGYCPVCMITRAELVRGLPGESHVYKGRTYQFVSAAEKQVFMADPTRYLPAEDGYCVVTWAEQHRREAGNIELPALFGDYLYLFAKEEARQKFLRDPERYVDPNGRARRIPLQTFRGDASNVR
jgi:YHS domain-containing protein